MKKDFREIILEAGVFMLIFSIDKKYTEGKRIRKKICKNLKKSLATQREHYTVNEWLYYINIGHKITIKANDNMKLEEAKINRKIDPSLFLNMLSNKIGSSSFSSKNLIEDINLSSKDMVEFKNIYKGSNLSLSTLMFTNRLKEEILLVEPYEDITDKKKEESLNYVKNL